MKELPTVETFLVNVGVSLHLSGVKINEATWIKVAEAIRSNWPVTELK